MKNKNKKTEKDVNTYIKRLKGLGIFGIIFSICLIGFDVYTYSKGFFSIFSIIVDILLFVFSIYFIIKSNNLINNQKK